MNLINNLSIKTKIVLLIVIISTINIVAASMFFLDYEKKRYKKEIKNKIEVLSNIVIEFNTVTMLFEYKDVASEYISSLKKDEHVLKVQLIKKDNTEFAVYESKKEQKKVEFNYSVIKDTITFINNVAIVNKPIFFDNDTLGAVRIQYSLDEHSKKVENYTKTTVIILMISILLSLILAFIFQKIITKPIFMLYNTMNKISINKDYSIRSKIRSKDEIGQLSDGFNSMIFQIEQQTNYLNKAKEKAVVSLKAKERFLANMTHELRTPLNSIIGLSNLLSETELKSEQNNYLNNIKSSSSHLLNIINDLLEYSKLGANKLQFEKREFEITKIIERIEGSMKFELQKKNLKFSTYINKDVKHILIGDEHRLNQILINLIGNAIKFTPEGSIKLEVYKLFETESVINIEFKIIDTGIGIKKEKQKIIFDSFSQASDGITREYGGTGLGLSITKELIEHQGGEIKVESTKNKGSVFSFIIPYKKKKNANTVLNLKQNYAPNNIKILVVDDNDMNLLFTKSLLIKRKFDVETSNNGNDAIDKIKNDNFNIILMDLYMPEIDGYETTRKIRLLDNENKKNIPIIALTAAATIIEIDRCFKVGMNDYLIKPFEVEKLVNKILKLINKTDK